MIVNVGSEWSDGWEVKPSNSGNTWTTQWNDSSAQPVWIGDWPDPNTVWPSVPQIPNQPWVTVTGTSALPIELPQPTISKDGCKPDVLLNFFGRGVHALAFFGDEVRFFPFMERFGMVWLQGKNSCWVPYDKEVFTKFIDDDTQQSFVAVPLTRAEVLKHLANPKAK